jgi:hypothetical protein
MAWVPDRGEVIWIDHNPQAGRERKDHHPFLVLSTAPFQASVGLVMGCAMTAAAYNRGSSLAVDQAAIQGDQRAFVVHRQRQQIGSGELGGIQQPIVDDAWAGEKAQAIGPEPVSGMGRQPLQQGSDHRRRAGTVIGQVAQAPGAEPANQRCASARCRTSAALFYGRRGRQIVL